MPETPHDLDTKPWPTVQRKLDAADGVVLPLGSTEQHSLHLPLAVDTLRADHLTAALVERAPSYDLSLVRLPPLPYGYSEHHMNYSGTVSINPETYTRVVVDIGSSMEAHGVDRLIVVNFHGGNREPLKLATDRLQRETELTVHPIDWVAFADPYLTDAFGDGWGHAGDHETAVIELFRPDLVVAEAKEPQIVADRPTTGRYAYFDDITEQGGLGDPTNADPAVMESIVEQATQDLLEALTADIQNGW